LVMVICQIIMTNRNGHGNIAPWAGAKESLKRGKCGRGPKLYNFLVCVPVRILNMYYTHRVSSLFL
jgi:hypothetical protein